MEHENKVNLDLNIIKLKHKLKNIKLKPRYKLLKEYNETLDNLKELLKKQKTLDKLNFYKNLMSIQEFKDDVFKRKKNKALYLKLNNFEKDFIKENQYDYLNDNLNLLTNNTSPNCELVYKWKNLKLEIFNKNIRD